jgi:hypothetical protein
LLWLLEGGVVVVAFIFHCSTFYFKFISFLDIAETLLTVKQQSIKKNKYLLCEILLFQLYKAIKF